MIPKLTVRNLFSFRCNRQINRFSALLGTVNWNIKSTLIYLRVHRLYPSLGGKYLTNTLKIVDLNRNDIIDVLLPHLDSLFANALQICLSKTSRENNMEKMINIFSSSQKCARPHTATQLCSASLPPGTPGLAG